MRRLALLLLVTACAGSRPVPAPPPQAPPPAAEPAPSPTPSAEPARAPWPPEGFRLRLRAGGDVMMGSDFPEPDMPPEDGATILASVADLLRDADLTFVNLEGPLCDGGFTEKCRPGQNCYAFRTPTRYGRYLADAGVDVVSTANNHASDFGEECRRQTESTLDGLGIPWSGPPGSVATLERGGARIALVAFHTSSSCNHLNDFEAAKVLVEVAAKSHDLVIVSFHGGAEGSKAQNVPHGEETFYGENRGDLRAFARLVIAAGADVVLGHGPHVLRGMEIVDGRLVAYSLGNFATFGRFNLRGPNGVSMVLEVELDAEGRFTGGRILPVRLAGRGIPEPDPDRTAIDLVRRLSLEDFPGTAPEIDDDGTVRPRGDDLRAGR